MRIRFSLSLVWLGIISAVALSACGPTAARHVPIPFGAPPVNGPFPAPPPPSASVPPAPAFAVPRAPRAGRRVSSSAGHAAFFSGEASLGSGAYYLQFPNSTVFGYYAYLDDTHYIYHFDLGYEYVFDSSDPNAVYFYDFASGHFWYTGANLFPYVYDFTLKSFLYYYPDAHAAGHYTTNPRYFFNFKTGQIIAMPDLQPPSGTGAITWTSVGPRMAGVSGEMIAFAKAGSTYYAGGGGGAQGNYSAAGVFKSSDSGTTFAPSDNGLTDRSVNTLWTSPDGGVVLCGTNAGGIFRSTDAAASWTQVSTARAVIAIVAVGTTLYAGTASGVMQSQDLGATWSIAFATTSPVTSLADAGPLVYIGLADGTVLQNGGSGTTFTQKLRAGGTVLALAIDQQSTQVVYAAIEFDFRLNVTRDGGSTWNRIQLPYSTNVQAIVTSAVFPQTVYVGTHSPLFVSTDQGVTWQTFPGLSADMRSVFSFANGSGEAVVVSSDQGTFMTTDGGGSWNAVTSKLSTFLVTGVGVFGSTITASLQDFPSIVSYDSGSTWTFPNNGGGEGGPATINPGNSLMCYFYGVSGYVYSTNGCHTLQTSPTLPAQKSATTGEYGPGSIAIDPQSANTVLVATQSGVYRSTDGGATFTSTGWPFSAARVVAFDPSNDNNVFVVNEPSVYVFGTLSLSHDGGATWSSSNLPSAGLGSAENLMLAIHPTNSNLVIAALNTATSAAGLSTDTLQIYRSTNGGATFSAVSAVPNGTGYPSAGLGQFLGAYPCGMSFNPESTTPYLALACSGGVYVSTDNGGTWSNVTGNARAPAFGALTWNNGSLYVGSFGQGILKSSAQLQTQTLRRTQGVRAH